MDIMPRIVIASSEVTNNTMSTSDPKLLQTSLLTFDLSGAREEAAGVGLPRMTCSHVGVHYGGELAVSDVNLK